jgi:molecular chaperone DnaK (HSP70)
MAKGFLVTALKMFELEGSNNVPTVLYYPPNGQPVIGDSAVSAAERRHELLNEDFKVDLGYVNPTSRALREKFVTASGSRKSAVGLTADFLHALLLKVEIWLQRNAVNDKVTLLLAEPLSLGTELASADWLSNYRNNLRRIISGRPSIADIDFLPEPFAVFQYYRHGLRHPLITERAKYNALVMDFGGGTFDVCLIETTREGDEKEGGRNSKPLAASSTAIGGYYVNRTIAETLFRNYSTQGAKKRDDRLAGC